MKSLKSCAHSLRLYSSNPNPEQVHFPGECSRIAEYPVVVSLWIHFPIPQHPARSAESADVGKEIEMIQRDLKRLHSSHRKASHRTVIAIRERPVSFINEWNQGLSDIVCKRRRHALHRLQSFSGTGGTSGQIGRSLAGASCVTICHHDDHRLALSSRE